MERERGRGRVRGGVGASPGMLGTDVAQVTRWMAQQPRKATCQGTTSATRRRTRSIERTVFRVMPASAFVLFEDFSFRCAEKNSMGHLVRTRRALRMGHMTTQSMYQLMVTKPVAIKRTRGASGAKKTSPPLPRT